MSTSSPVLPPVLHIFRTVATAVVPEAASLRPDEWLVIEQTIEVALAPRPLKMKRQLASFCRLLEWLPLIKHGSRLTKMSASRRGAFLATMQDSKNPLFRRGFWGLRTLIFMGYYTRPEAAVAIGYRAHPGGWAQRRLATGAGPAADERGGNTPVSGLPLSRNPRNR